MNNSNIKTAVFWVVIIMVVVSVVDRGAEHQGADRCTALTYTQLMNDVQHGKIKSVTITGNDLHGLYKESNDELHAVIPTNHQPLDDAMLAKGVDVKYQEGEPAVAGCPFWSTRFRSCCCWRSGSS